MFKLFFDDESGKDIKESLSHLISFNNKNQFDNIFEEKYEEFNEEFAKFINFHLLKIAANCNNNQVLDVNNNPNFNINDYIKNFILKFIKIYDLNYKYNGNNPMYDFINLNISTNLCDEKTDKEYMYLIFFKIFEQQIKRDELDSKENIIFINEVLEKLKIILTNITKYYSKGNFEQIIFIIFCERFLNTYTKMIYINYNESKFKSTNTLTEFFLFFLPFYDNIIYKIFFYYFKDISLVNKEITFIDKLIYNLSFLNIIKERNKEKGNEEKEIELISNLFLEKKQLTILKILSLLNNDINLKNYFINIILKGIEKYLLSTLKKEQNSLDKFRLLKEIEKTFFNEINIEFFFKDFNSEKKNIEEEFQYHNIFIFPTIIKKYHNIIYDVLSK